MAWYNLNVDATEAQLKGQELIICGTYRDIFLFELGFDIKKNGYFLQINEGEALTTYNKAATWAEIAKTAQMWIDRLQETTNNTDT